MVVGMGGRERERERELGDTAVHKSPAVRTPGTGGQIQTDSESAIRWVRREGMRQIYELFSRCYRIVLITSYILSATLANYPKTSPCPLAAFVELRLMT